MHDGDEVGLVLLAREEGMTLREAAELAGVPLSTAGAWAAGLLPRSYTVFRQVVLSRMCIDF